MAAGKLEVNVTANTSQLKQGLQESTASVEKAANQMNKAGAKTAGFTDKAVKGLAMIGAVEGSIKAANVAFEAGSAILAAMQGDSEGVAKALDAMAETAMQLPFGIGAVVSAIDQLARSIMGVNEALEEVEEANARLAKSGKILETTIAFKKNVEDGNSALRDRLDILKSEDEWARRVNTLQQERRKMEHELQDLIEQQRQATGRDPFKAKQLLKIIADRKMLIQEIFEAEKKLADQAAEQKRIEEDRLKAEERRLKILEAQRKAEEKRLKREKEFKRLAEERQTAEKELLDAQASARESQAQATGTFSTAGGSFTTGMDAQLNETKLMRGISEKSRELLQKISENMERRVKQPMLM